MSLEDKFKTGLEDLELPPERRDSAERVVEAVCAALAEGGDNEREKAVAAAAVDVVDDALVDARRTIETAEEVAT